MKAVILAAGKGTRLEPITSKIPKCMAPVAGIPLIDRMIARIEAVGIDEVIIVTGYLEATLKEHLAGSSSKLARDATLVFNEHYHDWGNFYSLLVARDAIGDSDYIRLDGDVLLDGAILPALLAAPGPGVLAIDGSVDLAEEEMKARRDDAGRIVELNKRMAPADAFGEFIGVDRIDRALAPAVFGELEAMIPAGETDEYYERAYERLMHNGAEFHSIDVSGFTWSEIDDLADLERAHQLARAQDAS